MTENGVGEPGRPLAGWVAVARALPTAVALGTLSRILPLLVFPGAVIATVRPHRRGAIRGVLAATAAMLVATAGLGRQV